MNAARNMVLLAFFCLNTWAQQPSRSSQSGPTPLSPQELFKRASPSVFVVEALNSEGSVIAFGSGVATVPDLDSVPLGSRAGMVSVVVTNKHVVEGGAALRVKQGQKTWPAKLAQFDPDHDLCGLEVEGLRAQPAPVRLSSTLVVGEKAYAIGAPEGLESLRSRRASYRDFENTVRSVLSRPQLPSRRGQAVAGYLILTGAY